MRSLLLKSVVPVALLAAVPHSFAFSPPDEAVVEMPSPPAASVAADAPPASPAPAPAAAPDAPAAPAASPEAETPQDPRMAELQKIADTLTYREGVIDLPGGHSTAKMGSELVYLDAADTKKLLVEIYGNPPAVAEDVIGAILPKGLSPLHPDSWTAVLTYSNEGHIDDADAAGLNYDDLLGQMQVAIRDANDERVKQGYEPLTLVGWAEPPRYDQPSHKLYWAKRIKFGNSPDDTLNYAIRVLGRNGVLEVNIIAGVSQLSMVNTKLDGILKAIEFKDGWRYADFDPNIDQKAAYGIGGLIAGAAAAKLGGKGLIALVAAFWKFIVIGIGAAVAGIASLFRRRSE
jgi:uncharacterized membrane-anchored protein